MSVFLLKDSPTAAEITANSSWIDNDGFITFDVNNNKSEIYVLIDTSKLATTHGLSVDTITAINVTSVTDGSVYTANDDATKITNDTTGITSIIEKITLVGLTTKKVQNLTFLLNIFVSGALKTFTYNNSVTLLGPMDTPIIRGITHSNTTATLTIEPSSEVDLDGQPLYNDLLLDNILNVSIAIAGQASKEFSLNPTSSPTYTKGQKTFDITGLTADTEYKFSVQMTNKQGEFSATSAQFTYALSSKQPEPDQLAGYISDNFTGVITVKSSEYSDIATGTTTDIQNFRPTKLLLYYYLVSPEVISQTGYSAKISEFKKVEFPFVTNEVTGKTTLQKNDFPFEVPNSHGCTLQWMSAVKNTNGIGSSNDIQEIQIPANHNKHVAKIMSVIPVTGSSSYVEVTIGNPEPKEGLKYFGHELQLAILDKNKDVSSAVAPTVQSGQSGVYTYSTGNKFAGSVVSLNDISTITVPAKNSNKLPAIVYNTTSTVKAQFGSALSPYTMIRARTIAVPNRNIRMTDFDSANTQKNFVSKDLTIDATTSVANGNTNGDILLNSKKFADYDDIVVGDWTQSSTITSTQTLAALTAPLSVVESKVTVEGVIVQELKVSYDDIIDPDYSANTNNLKYALAETAATFVTTFSDVKFVKLYIVSNITGSVPKEFSADPINGGSPTVSVTLEPYSVNGYSVFAQVFDSDNKLIGKTPNLALSSVLISGPDRKLEGSYTVDTQAVENNGWLNMAAATAGVRAKFAIKYNKGQTDLDQSLLNSSYKYPIFKIGELKRLVNENLNSNEGQWEDITFTSDSTASASNDFLVTFATATDTVSPFQKYVTLLLSSTKEEFALQRFRFNLYRVYSSVSLTDTTSLSIDYTPERIELVFNPILKAPVVHFTGSKDEVTGIFTNPTTDIDSTVMTRIETYLNGMKNVLSLYDDLSETYTELSRNTDSIVRATTFNEVSIYVAGNRSFSYTAPFYPLYSLKNIDIKTHPTTGFITSTVSSSKTSHSLVNVDNSPEALPIVAETYYKSSETDKFGILLSCAVQPTSETAVIKLLFDSNLKSNKDTIMSITPSFTLNSVTGKYEQYVSNSAIVTGLSKTTTELITEGIQIMHNSISGTGDQARASLPASIKLKLKDAVTLPATTVPATTTTAQIIAISVVNGNSGGFIVNTRPQSLLELGGHINAVAYIKATKYIYTAANGNVAATYAAQTPLSIYQSPSFLLTKSAVTTQLFNVSPGLHKVELIIPAVENKHPIYTLDLAYHESTQGPTAGILKLEDQFLGIKAVITDNVSNSSTYSHSAHVMYVTYIEDEKGANYGKTMYLKSLEQQIYNEKNVAANVAANAAAANAPSDTALAAAAALANTEYNRLVTIRDEHKTASDAAIANPNNTTLAKTFLEKHEKTKAQVMASKTPFMTSFIRGLAVTGATSAVTFAKDTATNQRLVMLNSLPIGKDLSVTFEVDFDSSTAGIANITASTNASTFVAYEPEILSFKSNGSTLDILVQLNGSPLKVLLLLASYEGSSNIGNPLIEVPVGDSNQLLTKDIVLYHITQTTEATGFMAIAINSKGVDMKVSPTGTFGLSSTASAVFNKTTMDRFDITVQNA